jgi:selenocysteine lyase/cysteine desulfurase
MATTRQLFDIGPEIAYLNCAYMGPLPLRSAEIGARALAAKTTPWKITVDDFFTPVAALREALARIVGGDVDGVAITPSVSYGLATAAHNLVVTVRPGSRILVLAEQFPSNVYLWRQLAQQQGAIVDTVSRPADSDWTSALLEAIGSDVSLVAVSAVHWTDGTVVDLTTVRAATSEVGAALVIDGIQSIGADPIDVATLQPDFLVGASYKWLLGPYSVGFCWVHPRHRQGQPIEHNWIARANSQDFAGLANYVDDYQPGARRFDMGEVSNFALVPTALASLELLLERGVHAIADHARALTSQVASEASHRGLTVASPQFRSPHLIGVRLPAGGDPRLVAAGLADDHVYVSVRGDSIRVSAHAFNTAADVGRLFASLDRLGVSAH